MRLGIVFTILLLAAPAIRAEDAGSRTALDALLPAMTRWDPERIRELGRRLATLPDDAAAAALWLATAAPSRIDTSQFFAMALSSPSPVIRRQAIDIVAANESPDGLRLLTSLLIGERDPETIAAVVAAIARQSEKRAVPALIAILLDPKTPSAVSAETAERLRRLTRTNLSDSPTVWRDWWMDHSHLYE